MLPKELINIEIDFALRVAELKPTSITDALLNYTSLYSGFFVPSPTRDPNQEIWVAFIKSIQGKDLKRAAWDFNVMRAKERDRYVLKPIYNGKPCFIYHIQGDTVFLHFNNNEGAEPGPLSKQSMPARLHELKNIFSDLHANHPEIKTVSGYSWLYNLESYKRLFPQPFTQNPTKITDDFGYNIFGQFLNSAHQIKQDAKKNFLKNVKNAKTYNEVIQAFEFYPLKVQAAVEVFFEFY